jgi:NDP-sugar pyrophosphorylase family protein
MTRVVIMAGGRGLRLHPLTQHQPKPLIQVGGKPMIETLVDGFIKQGFTDFTMCLGYRADLIRDHFINRDDAEFEFVIEDEPLGTAGALKLMSEPQHKFIVINADVMCDIDYNDLLEHHSKNHSEATMVGALYQHQIPYGVIESTHGTLNDILEKPIHNSTVSAGIYVLPPWVIDLIPDGPFDMPDLLRAITWVGVYPHDGFWEDVGTFEALERVRG